MLKLHKQEGRKIIVVSNRSTCFRHQNMFAQFYDVKYLI